MAGCAGQNCPLACGDCDFCAHYFNCTCAAFCDSKFESCKHVHLVGRFLQSSRTEWKMLPDPEPTFPAPATDEQETDVENARLNDALGARFSLISARFSQMSARFSEMATQISSGTLEIGTE